MDRYNKALLEKVVATPWATTGVGKQPTPEWVLKGLPKGLSKTALGEEGKDEESTKDEKDQKQKDNNKKDARHKDRKQNDKKKKGNTKEDNNNKQTGSWNHGAVAEQTGSR